MNGFILLLKLIPAILITCLSLFIFQIIFRSIFTKLKLMDRIPVQYAYYSGSMFLAFYLLGLISNSINLKTFKDLDFKGSLFISIILTVQLAISPLMIYICKTFRGISGLTAKPGVDYFLLYALLCVLLFGLSGHLMFIQKMSIFIWAMLFSLPYIVAPALYQQYKEMRALNNQINPFEIFTLAIKNLYLSLYKKSNNSKE